MKEEVEEMLEYLEKLTKEEADFVEHVLSWPHEYKSAFIVAKCIFDQEFTSE